MIILKLRLCPFGSEQIEMAKSYPYDVVPQLGGFVIEVGHKHRIAMIDYEFSFPRTIVHLADFKAAKTQVDEVVKDLLKAGWSISKVFIPKPKEER